MDLDGPSLMQNGYFDYLYTQKLDQQGNYAILYRDNQTDGGRVKRNKHPEWHMGIVTYVHGQFNYSHLKLSTEETNIIPVKAKQGFILLQEIAKDGKSGQLRLEKINY